MIKKLYTSGKNFMYVSLRRVKQWSNLSGSM